MDTPDIIVDGHTYHTWRDQESDNVKIFHELILPNGTKLDIDWTPYSVMTEAEVRRYINLGYPCRIGLGPLDAEDLTYIEQYLL